MVGLHEYKMVGLIENPSAFQRRMMAGPEQARILTEFEDHSLNQKNTAINNMSKATQLRNCL